MSYFQPLITSAFASYSVSRNAYADRAPGVTQGETDNQAGNVGNVQPNERVGSTSGTEKTPEVGKTVEQSVDRDAGKPQSASGDVLDLSTKAQEAYETRANSDEVDRIIADLNEQAEADVEEYQAAREQDSIELETSVIEIGGEVQNLAATQAGSETALESSSELTEEEQQQVEELKARDAEVRTHEQQHVAAGGQYVTGGPSYTYQTGPDGQQYAIGGEVSIDVGEVSGDPEATIRKMQTVAAAAMAPAEPSGQDYKVAADARQKEAAARAELNARQAAEMSGESEESTDASQSPAADESVASDSSDESEEPAANSSSISVATKSGVSSTAGAAYQAAGSMTSGQSTGSLFSAFA